MSDEAKIILKDMQIEEMRKEIISQDQFIAQLEKEYDKEIERLNNIINEFEKWLKEEIRIFEDGKDDEYEGIIYNAKIIILDKLQELKGNRKELMNIFGNF